MCEHCGQRPIADGNRFYCSRACSNAAKRGVQVNDKAAQYDELLWLLDGGTGVYDALRRCGIPTADAAHTWAVRHQHKRLEALLRDAYNEERAAQKRRRRRQREDAA